MKYLDEIIASIFIITFGLLCFTIISKDERINPVTIQAKPCKCPSLFTQQVWFEKHQMFMDSMEHANKANRERLTDSVRKYNQLLRRNEL